MPPPPRAGGGGGNGAGGTDGFIAVQLSGSVHFTGPRRPTMSWPDDKLDPSPLVC